MSNGEVNHFADWDLEIGDLIFIRVDNFLYRRVAAATQSWTSHVGVMYGQDEQGNWLVAESKVPLSKISSLESFIARSQGGRYSVHRLKGGLTDEQKARVRKEAEARLGIRYHFGFDFDSPRQFCSKYAYEVIHQATGREVGEIHTFGDLKVRQPDYPMLFWRIWFMGRIPWQRRTISPASQYLSPELETLRDYSKGS